MDFSPASRRSLRFAEALAGSFDAHLHLLHVIEPPIVPQWGYAHLALREAKLHQAAMRELALWRQESALPHRLLAPPLIRSGAACSEVCQAASELPADLIVMASHGLGFRHPLPGSTAERVLRHAPCHVLAVRERSGNLDPDGSNVFPPRRIILTTDFSAQSLTAFPYAAALAKKFEASLTLLHIVPVHLPLELSQIGILVREQGLLREAQARVLQVQERHFQPDQPIKTVVRSGVPAHDICSNAREEQADLIVMSTHGHTGLQHFLLGSVAENVVRHAPCPVLIIRKANEPLNHSEVTN